MEFYVTLYVMEPAELKAYRKSQNLTQEGFAKWLNSTKRSVVAWETGQNPVPSWVADKINQSRMFLNPKVAFDVFKTNEALAEAEGLTMDGWLAKLMEEAAKKAQPPTS